MGLTPLFLSYKRIWLSKKLDKIDIRMSLVYMML